LRQVPFLDASGVLAVEELAHQARIVGTTVILAGLQPQPMEMLRRGRLGPASGTFLYSPSYRDALETAGGIARKSTAAKKDALP
jgi:SulP family sulfate permease